MLRSYFKIAFRNLVHNKAYSFINIAGLSLGIACCLLLALYVQDEFSYDLHHRSLENLYRIDTQFEGGQIQGSISPPIAMTLREELPEVESAVRVVRPTGASQSLIRYGDNIFYEPDGFVADSTLFEVLTYELTEGNPAKALTDANTVVLSQTLSKKLFSNESALDKSITISQGGPAVNYKVTGVFDDTKKSFLTASFFTSMLSEGMGQLILKDPETANEWAGQNFIPSYLKLVPGHSLKAVEKKINDVLIKYGAEDMKAVGFTKTLLLEPIKGIHLNSIADRHPLITSLYIIISIALFILLLACINFMNLSTAKATQRASEIGIRKVMGAFRSALIRQILGEAMIIVVISILFSVVLVQLALPLLNELSGKSISFNKDNSFYFVIALTGLTIFTGLAAGSYPAFYMSSFQPAEVLKGKFNLGNRSGRLRQGLVVIQFIVAIVLVCGMLVVGRQLSFMKGKDLGFDPRAKIIVPLRTGDARDKYETLRNEIRKNNGVKEVSAAEYPPGSYIFNDMGYYTDGGNMENAVTNRRNRIDEGYLELLGIKIIAGRTFTSNRQGESGKVIINRASAKALGVEPSRIVGQHLYFDWQGQKYTYEVVGVMENYNQTSLRDAIEPVLVEIAGQPSRYKFLIADINTSGFEKTIAGMEKTWNGLITDTPFEYSFLDENIQKQYDEDRRIAKIITAFTLVAMVICSLGLYGLSSFMAERRFKEIGVRKIMGASVTQIVTMMSREFIRLVLIAFLIAIPLAWYCMNRWLEHFEYKVPMEVSLFLYAGSAAVVIALFTISFESFRAANTNPATALRNE